MEKFIKLNLNLTDSEYMCSRQGPFPDKGYLELCCIYFPSNLLYCIPSVTDPIIHFRKKCLAKVNYLFLKLYFLFLRLVVDGRIPLIFCNQIITTIKVIPDRAQSFLLKNFWYLLSILFVKLTKISEE